VLKEGNVSTELHDYLNYWHKSQENWLPFKAVCGTRRARTSWGPSTLLVTEMAKLWDIERDSNFIISLNPTQISTKKIIATTHQKEIHSSNEGIDWVWNKGRVEEKDMLSRERRVLLVLYLTIYLGLLWIYQCNWPHINKKT